MAFRPHTWIAVLLAAAWMALPAYAQDAAAPPAGPAPANLAHVEGTVDLVLDGVVERADPPQMLIAGDVVRTRHGRAEIVFGDGTLLHLAEDSEIELLGDEHLRLLAGRAILRVGYSLARPYIVDTPASSVRLEREGEYVLTFAGARLDVGVARGTAVLLDASQPTSVSGGLQASLTAPGGRALLQPFNSARWDAFAQWAYHRAAAASGSPSSAQLPYELRPYAAVLDQHGRWDHIAPYGYVWIPSVGYSWRPYLDGSWSFTRYGWTWYGRDRFAWPTHHYGRWGFSGTFWFWMPARHWGPAWVSWSIAPSYVSWSPLGWDGRPVFGLRGRRDHPAYRPDYTPWRGWTVVPRRDFAPRRNARQHAVDVDRLDDVTRRTLAASQAVPVAAGRDRAVSRDAAPAASPRGNVRRPSVPSRGAAGAASTAPGSRVWRSGDAPDYAPPATWGAEIEERRGGSRRAPTAAGSERDRTAAPGAVGRGAPMDDPYPMPRRIAPGAVPSDAAAPDSPSRARPQDAPAYRVPPTVPDRAPRGTGPVTDRGGAPDRGGAAERGGGAERGGTIRGGDRAIERGSGARRGGSGGAVIGPPAGSSGGQGAGAPPPSGTSTPPPAGGARRRPPPS